MPFCLISEVIHPRYLIIRHKAKLYHLNLLLCHFGGQLKTAVEQEVGEKIDCKR